MSVIRHTKIITVLQTKQKEKCDASDLVDLINEIFKNSANNYGTIKIKVNLAK